jgi:hypothetical protein
LVAILSCCLSAAVLQFIRSDSIAVPAKLVHTAQKTRH